MPPNWAARWHTISTLILQPSRLPSLTSALLSIRVGPRTLGMLVKKYGESGCKSITSPWYMNSPPISRESATWLSW